MSHVEFIGPPGAGKTAIHASLTDGEKWYGATLEETCRRKLLNSGSLKYRLCFRAMPESMRSFLGEQVLTYRYRTYARKRFGNQHPAALQQISSGISTVEYQPKKLASLMESTIERYQLGTETTREGEVLCLDEGFGMGAASILWRRPSDQFSLKEYLRHTPTPDVLVHVRAPSETCLHRQEGRGYVSIREPWTEGNLREEQARLTDLCTKVADELRSTTTVVTIDNTDTIESAVERTDHVLTDRCLRSDGREPYTGAV